MRSECPPLQVLASFGPLCRNRRYRRALFRAGRFRTARAGSFVRAAADAHRFTARTHPFSAHRRNLHHRLDRSRTRRTRRLAASQQFVDITQQLPSYKKPIEDKLHSLPGLRSPTLNRASDTVQELAKEVAAVTPGAVAPTDTTKKTAVPLGSSVAKPLAVEVVPPINAIEAVESTLGPLLTALVIAVFTIFILMGREDLRDRFLRLAGGKHLSTMTQALDDATRRINRYLLLQLTVNIGYGLVVGICLHLIGIPSAALWGLSATILRFLPYVGPPLAALMPILLSIAAFCGWSHTLATMGLFFGLELIVSNVIEPLLYGAHVGLSPLAILVAAIFWTLIWGCPAWSSPLHSLSASSSWDAMCRSCTS